eukprot:m.888 g.888  ORF g.888 m.888 type:complete len:71 (+) comp696_c0_seq1:113-325(+)
MICNNFRVLDIDHAHCPTIQQATLTCVSNHRRLQYLYAVICFFDDKLLSCNGTISNKPRSFTSLLDDKKN